MEMTTRLLILALAWGLLAGPAAHGDSRGWNAATVEQTLTALEVGVGSAAPVLTVTVLDSLERRLGLSATDLRRELGCALDSVEAHRERRSDLWVRLTRHEVGDLRARSADRLLRELVAAGRRAIGGNDNYVLQASVAHAARRADVPVEDATTLLVWSLGQVMSPEEAQEAGEVGFVVSGLTRSSRLDMEQVFLFLGTRDEAAAAEAVREVHRFVVPRVVTRLPKSPHVKWAIRDRDLTPLLDPDLRLIVRVEQLYFKGSGTVPLPCIDLELDLRRDGQVGPGEEMDLAVCEEERDERARRDLMPLYDRAADAVYARIARMLKEGWTP